MADTPTINVLFVCSGNICRSPAAEGVFRALVAAAALEGRIGVDSAGTGSWHAGEAPDDRMRATAAARGYDLNDLRARQVRNDDFAAFDYIVAMDRGHLDHLRALCPAGETRRLHLFLQHAPSVDAADVPDPYYGGGDGFERVMDMVEDGAKGLLDLIRRTHFRDG